ncbi:MAG: hypothetical protein ABW185_27130 [Sedimenticola sp.]
MMKNLSTAHQQSETERRRQMERIAERREQRRQQKQTTEEKALELLERALEIDRRYGTRSENATHERVVVRWSSTIRS